MWKRDWKGSMSWYQFQSPSNIAIAQRCHASMETKINQIFSFSIAHACWSCGPTELYCYRAIAFLTSKFSSTSLQFARAVQSKCSRACNGPHGLQLCIFSRPISLLIFFSPASCPTLYTNCMAVRTVSMIADVGGLFSTTSQDRWIPGPALGQCSSRLLKAFGNNNQRSGRSIP